ncbi:Tat pathway signal sequence domain protein, partial [Opisthorchis viverrini]
GSIALTYFAVGWGYWAVVLFYGIFTGIGFGAGYSVIIATASEWFPNRRGLIVGLVLGGFGAGALLFTPVQTGFINPANLKKLYATGDFKPCSTGVPAASGNNSNSANNRISAHAGKTASEPFFSGNCNLDGLQKKSGMVDVPPLTVFKALDFYLLWLSVCCGAIPITLVTSLYKVAGSRYIYDDIFLAGVSMAASVCNSVGRVIWGRICDRISFKSRLGLLQHIWFVSQRALLSNFRILYTFSHHNLMPILFQGAYVLYVHLMDRAAVELSIHLRIHWYCRKSHVRPVGWLYVSVSMRHLCVRPNSSRDDFWGGEFCCQLWICLHSFPCWESDRIYDDKSRSSRSIH